MFKFTRGGEQVKFKPLEEFFKTISEAVTLLIFRLKVIKNFVFVATVVAAALSGEAKVGTIEVTCVKFDTV